MIRRRLPWEYAVRNVARRPMRSGLTLLALTIVVLLVFVVVGFVRGLERSLAESGDPNVVLVYGLAADNFEESSIPPQAPGLLAASIQDVRRTAGIAHVSPELYVATRVALDDQSEGSLGLVRGVTSVAPLVRGRVRIVEGRWPSPGEVLVGKLTAAKLGCDPRRLAVGRQVRFEGRAWRIAGRFDAAGSAYDSELWCRLDELAEAAKRQDLTLAAVELLPGGSAAEVDLFCKQRRDLELQAVRETEYYATIQQHYRPMRMLAWMVVWLIGASGVVAGLNTMYGAVVGRLRELAMLQAIGFRRRAIVISLIQEGVLLSSAASLLAATIALAAVNGMAVRFTMGAFALTVDGGTMLIGCGVGLMLGALGAIPPAVKALRLPVREGIRAV